MSSGKILLKYALAICLWFMMTNVESSLLIDNPDNCLTCIPTASTPPPTTPPTPSSPAGPSPASSPLPPCINCPPQDCSMVPEGTTFPYASHCKLYYKCIDRNAVMCTCENGWWYDRELRICQLCPLVLNCPANVD